MSCEFPAGRSAMHDLKWQPITFTLVEYPEGDLIGLGLAFMSLAPHFIIASFITLIWFRRDLHTITFFGGTMINILLNKVLKSWIQEPRPMARQHIHEEYGMPSSHSQFVGFFTIYATLFILLRLNNIAQHNALPFERASRGLLLLSCWAMAFLVSIGRTYLLYHTIQQVVVGAVIGGIFGILWFLFTHLMLSQFFPYIVSLKFSEFFMLRDTTLIPNILWFEYRTTRQEARARSRQLTRMKSQ